MCWQVVGCSPGSRVRLSLELTVFTDNEAAIALYQKFGFVTEGTLASYAFQHGKYRDVHSMARIRDA